MFFVLPGFFNIFNLFTMLTQVKIKPETLNNPMGNVYEFTQMQQNGKNWFNVTLHQGQKSYVLGSVISGDGFVSCEGTVVRTNLMEALSEFYKLGIKITATQLP